MSESSDIRAFILADAAVTALIGTRLYPVILPQAPVTPAVTYQLISDTGYQAMEGPTNLKTARFQFTAWDPTYLVAEQVFNAVKTRLDGVKALSGATQIERSFFQVARDLFEPDSVLYGRSGDFFIWTST